jgi:hypothetical protein
VSKNYANFENMPKNFEIIPKYESAQKILKIWPENY